MSTLDSDSALQIRLKQVLKDHFNKGELRDLCGDLDVDYDDLGGSGKADKARELVSYLARRERLSELQDRVRKLRPNTSFGEDEQGKQDEQGEDLEELNKIESWDTELKEALCINCGVRSVSCSEELLDQCSRCMTILGEPSDRIEEISGKIVTFSVTRREMEWCFLSQLVEFDYAPTDVISRSRGIRAFLVYLPFYLFKGKFYAEWSALSADHSQRYVSKVEGNFDVSASASKRPFLKQESKILENVSWSRIEEFKETYLKSAVLESFEVLSEGIYHYEVQPAVEQIALESVTSGERTPTDFRWETIKVPSVQAQRVFLPFWILCFMYDDKIYRMIMDGQDSTRLYGGYPKDERLIKQKKDVSLRAQLKRAKVMGIGCLVVIGLVFLCVLLPLSEDARVQLSALAVLIVVLVVFPFLMSVEVNVHAYLLSKWRSQRRVELDKWEKTGQSFFDS